MFNREPAMIMAVIQAVLALVLILGVPLAPGAEAAILAVAAAVLGLITRSQVTPVAAFPTRAGGGVEPTP